MDSPALTKLVVDAFGPWKIVIAPLLLSIPILWLCLRSGSPHMLLSRLWLIFFGKQQHDDAIIHNYLKRRSALMQFRIMTGVMSRTILQAHALIRWCDENDEEIGAVRRCGSYFDRIKLELKPEKDLPSKWHQCAKMVAIVVFSYAAMFVLALTVQDGLLVSVKGGSGVTMVLTEHQISRPLHFDANFTLRDCAAGYAPISVRTGIQENDIKAACSWLGDKDLPSYFRKGLTGQRAALSIPLVMFLWFCFVLFQWWMSGEIAKDMFKRLVRPASIARDGAASQEDKKHGSQGDQK